MFKNIVYNFNQLSNNQKSGSGTPAYTKYINRFLGKCLASVFAIFNITPNQVSILSGVITCLSFLGFIVIDLTIFSSILLVIMLLFGFSLDSADGQLARLMNLKSFYGEWLDHTLDAIKIPLGHATSMLLIISSYEYSVFTLIYFLIILSLSCGVFSSGILKSKLMINNSTNSIIGRASLLKSVLMLPVDYGMYILLFLFSYDISSFVKVYFIWSLFYIPMSILILYNSGVQLKSYRIS